MRRGIQCPVPWLLHRSQVFELTVHMSLANHSDQRSVIDFKPELSTLLWARNTVTILSNVLKVRDGK